MLAINISKLACMSGLAKRLIEAREAKEWTPAKLAAEMGVTRQAVEQIESGKTKNMRLENLFAAADTLGVKARWLATGKGPRLAQMSQTINTDILEQVLTDIEQALVRTGSKPAVAKKCELASTMYEMYIAGERPSNVVRFVKLIAKAS